MVRKKNHNFPSDSELILAPSAAPTIAVAELLLTFMPLFLRVARFKLIAGFL